MRIGEAAGEPRCCYTGLGLVAVLGIIVLASLGVETILIRGGKGAITPPLQPTLVEYFGAGTMLSLLSHLTLKGRIARTPYWLIAAAAMALLIAVSPLAVAVVGRFAGLIVIVPIYWLLFCLMAKRCHDIGRSAWWLLLLPVPLIGLLWVFAVLGFRRGQPGSNQYGPNPHRAPPDYLVVGAIK